MPETLRKYPMHCSDTYTFISEDEKATKALARSLASYLQPADVIILCGNLGAGKTRFVQGLAEALGIEEVPTSPTFNLLMEYTQGTLPLYHFDLYRLDTAEELENIAAWEYLEGNGVSCVEWGDKFADELGDDYLLLNLLREANGTRRIMASAKGPRGEELLSAWISGSGTPQATALLHEPAGNESDSV